MKLTTKEFIDRAGKIHGSKYDYSKVEYKNIDTKVCIVCPVHGEFWQTPYVHLKGHGCKQCGTERSPQCTGTGRDKFIEKAREIHGDRYDYSLVEYKNNKTKVRIICSEHGEFLQTPKKHLNDHGCPECAKVKRGFSRRLTTDKFVKRAKKIHKDKYDYSKTEYIISTEKVKIICPVHGEFYENPMLHLSGYGCKKCGERKAIVGARRSKPELSLYEYLSNKFDKNDVFYQYNSDSRYPFNCDFYVKSLDLFIEYNGFYMHGEHWFDKNNPEDVKKANEWFNATNPQSDAAYEVWTIRDVNKRNIAMQNNLNYVVLWTEQDIEDWTNKGCPVRQDWK